MAYVQTRQNFILSAVGCTIPDSILINYGVYEYIYITSQSGNFDSTNRVTCTVYHKNGIAEVKTVSRNGTSAYFQYGDGASDNINDIIFLWGYGVFLPPTYPSITNEISMPNGVTLAYSTGITSDNIFYILATPRIGTTENTDVTFKNVSAVYNNGVITEYATIKSYTSGLKRLFCILQNYDTQYNTVLQGVCGKSVSVASVPENAIFTLPTNVIDTETLNLTATANNGYYFQTAPTAVIYDSNTTIINTVNFTLNAADTTATIATLLLNLSNYSDVGHVDFYIAAIQQPTPTFVFVNNVDNATLSTSVNDNVVTATLTAPNSRWAFSTTPTVTYTVNGVSTTSNLTISESGQNVVSATITFTADIGTVQFNGVLERRVLIDDLSVHTTVNGIDVDYMFLNQTYNLQFVAAEDYCYETAPKLVIWGANIQDDINATLDDNDPHLAAILAVNLTQIYGEDVTDITAVDFAANGVPITAYNYGAINVYKVTTTILNSFAAKRYFMENNFAYDLGDYVITLKRLYFNVGLTVADVIKCGNFNTLINANAPVKDTVIIDCGNVTIPKYSNNVTDYTAEITAFLPFVGFVNISNDYIDKIVNLEYICSAVTGKGFAKLKCNEIVFNTFGCNVSDNLIFKAITDNAAINQLEFNKYNGLQPYVMVKHFDDLTEQINNNDNKRGVLSTFSGFVRCAEIENLTAVLPSEIREEIIEQLENGVYL